MDLVGSSLRRLQDTVSRFVVPSAALRDVRTLKAQIELRRRALRDIEVIRCRLRPFMRCGTGRFPPQAAKQTRRSAEFGRFIAGVSLGSS